MNLENIFTIKFWNFEKDFPVFFFNFYPTMYSAEEIYLSSFPWQNYWTIIKKAGN